MARDQAAKEEVLELLRLLGPVQARGMFGGWGLYLRGPMFGLVVEGQLYLKTDELTRPDFERAGCRPFVFDTREKTVATGYFTPPEDVADDVRGILPWARRALESAERAALRKRPATKAAAKKAAAKKPGAKQPSGGRTAVKKSATRVRSPRRPDR